MIEGQPDMYMTEMGEPKTKQDKIIAEIINHINSLDQKINSLNDKLDENKNTQLVNKLDIINLRNEIIKVRSSSPFLDPETQQIIEEIHELANDVKTFKNIKNTEKEFQAIKPRIMGNIEDIEELKNILNNMPRTQGKAVMGASDIISMRKKIFQIEKEFNKYDSVISKIGKGMPKSKSHPITTSQITGFERQIAALSKKIKNLSTSTLPGNKSHGKGNALDARIIEAVRKNDRSIMEIKKMLSAGSWLNARKTRAPVEIKSGKKCKKCRNIVRKTAKFCNKCGKKV